jgi:hypothetical protein
VDAAPARGPPGHRRAQGARARHAWFPRPPPSATAQWVANRFWPMLCVDPEVDADPGARDEDGASREARPRALMTARQSLSRSFGCRPAASASSSSLARSCSRACRPSSWAWSVSRREVSR